MLVKERCSDEISDTGEPIINEDIMGECPLNLYKKHWLGGQSLATKINGEKTEFFCRKEQLYKSEMTCPSREALIDYIFDKNTRESDEFIKSHLGMCTACQRKLLFGKT